MARPRSTKPSASRVSKAGSDLIQASSDTVLDVISGQSANGGPRSSEMETYWMLYTKHPWVSTCVSLISEAVSAEGFAILPVDGVSGAPASDKDDERLGHIHQFFASATPGSTFSALRLSTAVDLRVFGLAYWRKKRVSKRGLPLFLERLDPRRIRVNLNAARTAIESFSLRKSTQVGVLDTSLDAEKILAEDVVFFRMNGGDPLFGAPSPLEALDLTISQDWSIRRHREAFFRNGGVSGRVIQITGVNEETARKIQKRLRADKTGVEAAFLDLVLPGDDIKVTESSATQGKNEFDFTKGSQALRDEIFAVYKVPIGKIMSTPGALGQAGKAADDDTFQRDAVLPVERVIYDTLTLDLLAKDFGITDLRLVPQRLNQIRLDRFDAALQAVQFGATGNESRALAGLPAIDDPRFDMSAPLFINAKNPVAQDSPAPGPSDKELDGTDDLESAKDDQQDEDT